MKSILLFIAVIMWNFYMTIIYNSIIYVSFLALEILLLAAGICQVLFIKNRVSAEIRTLMPAADTGRSIRCELIITNRSAFRLPDSTIKIEYVNIFTGRRETVKKHVCVKKRSETVVDFDVSSGRCGVVNIKIKKLIISDAIRFVKINKKCSAQSDVIFLPKLIEMDMEVDPALLSFIGESDEYDSNRSGDDPSEVYRIREYTQGDRLQRVHWKASAKSDKLMVKDFSRPLACSLLIAADIKNRRTEVWKNADSYVQLLVSYSLMLIGAGCHHYVAWYDKKSDVVVRQAVHSMEDVYVLMNSIMRSVPYTEDKDVEEMYKAAFPYETYLKSYVFSMDLIMREGEMEIWDGKDFLKES